MSSRRKENQVVCLVLMLVSFIFFACPSSSDPLVAPKDPEKSPIIDYKDRESHPSGENPQTGTSDLNGGGSSIEQGDVSSEGEKKQQDEIAPQRDLIEGSITSIVTLEGYVYACDASVPETIYVRWKFDDLWEKADRNPQGKIIKQLAVGVDGIDSSRSTLYALATDNTLWILDVTTGEWREIATTDSQGEPVNGSAIFNGPKAIFDFGYHHQTGKDSSKAYVLDNKDNYFDLIGTDCPRGINYEQWLSSVITEQGPGWYYYAPNNGREQKVAFYGSSINKAEIDLKSQVLSLACSPRGSLYAATDSGLKKIGLDIYGSLSGHYTDVTVGAGAGKIQTVFVQELVIDGEGFEVILVGCDNGLWSYNSYDKTWKQNKLVH